MQVNLNSDLVSYDLSDADTLNGQHLNHLQRAVLQNERVDIITQLAYLTPTSLSAEGKETYWQQEAFLRGQLSIIILLLDRANQVESTLKGI